MAADRQISQLVLQVDANIAVAQRSLNDLARTVNQTSGQMNTALGSTSAAHTKLNGAFNQTRLAQMELSHVMTASVDAYAAGASPLRILTLEMGRVAQAASFMGGGTGVLGKLGAFMSGPWGIAVLLATSVLGQLIGKMGQGSESIADLVEKMREHAKEAEKSKLADDAWSNSIDGLIDRNEKLVETLNKRLTVEGDIELQQQQGAQRDKVTADKALQDAQTKLRNLEVQQKANQGAPSGVGIGQGASVSGVSGANLSNQIAKAKGEVADAQRAVETANAAIVKSTVTLGQEEGKALSNLGAAADLWAKRYQSALTGIETANKGALSGSSKTISASFETLKTALGDAAGAGASKAFYAARNQAKDLGNELAKTGNVSKYTAEVAKLVATLEAAAKAARDAKKDTASTSGEFGRQVSFADATAIAKGAGLTVTSGYRSEAKQAELYRTVRTAQNPVARPGTSAHEGVNGKWALDIAFAPGLSAQSLKKIYGDQGVSLSAVYKESGHFHIEGKQTQAGRAASPTSQARADQKQATDDDAFARESAQLDAEILATKQQLLGGFDSQADFATQQVEADKKALLASIQKQEDAKTIGKDQADALRVQADDLAAAREAVIARREYTDNLQSLAEQQKQATDFQVSDLKFADEMAKTQGEHRRLQLEILDIQYKQKEADLERLLATIQSNKDFAISSDLQRQALELQGQLAHLPIERAQDQTRVQQGTLDPLQKYFNDLPHTADQINQALGSIEADGIQGLVNALSHAGEGWGAMRDLAISALQDIAQKLIQLGIEKLLFNTLGSVLGGALGGGGSGIGAVAGVGSTAAGAGSALSSFGGFRASGGSVTAGMPYIVGEHRPELFVPSTSGFIMPSVPRISIPKAANSNAGDTYHVNVAVHGGGGTPLQNRQTGLQVAAGVEAGLARRRAKGTAG